MKEALLILKAATEMAQLATRAIEASNNGDDEAARDYLRQARERYASARAAWDEAAARNNWAAANDAD